MSNILTDDALALCDCGRCDLYKAPEQWCAMVYRAVFDLELRQARVLAKLDGAATNSERHGDVYTDIVTVYRAELARRRGAN